MFRTIQRATVFNRFRSELNGFLKSEGNPQHIAVH